MKKWTIEEIGMLVNNPTMQADELQNLLPQRTVISIEHKKVRLGIKTWPKFSITEKEFLIKNYYSAPREVLIKALKRKWSTIQSRSHVLGLKRSKTFTANALKQRWNDEKYRNMIIKHINKINNDPLIRPQLTEKLKKWIILNKDKLKETFTRLNKDPEFNKKRLEGIAKLWNDEHFRKKFFEAGSKTGYYGSKGQNHAFNYLRSVLKNIEVINNDWSILKTRQVDIIIPKYKVAIEYNGPFHYYPIRGKKKLKEAIRKDREKRDKLEIIGWRLFIIKADRNNITKIEIESQCDEIVKNIEGFGSFSPSQKCISLYQERPSQ